MHDKMIPVLNLSITFSNIYIASPLFVSQAKWTHTKKGLKWKIFLQSTRRHNERVSTVYISVEERLKRIIHDITTLLDHMIMQIHPLRTHIHIYSKKPRAYLTRVDKNVCGIILTQDERRRTCLSRSDLNV